MTKEERKLVIEYLNEDVYINFDSFTDVIRERMITNHFDTLNFKVYALRHALRVMFSPLVGFIKQNLQTLFIIWIVLFLIAIIASL